jgi:hypothetical protein
MCALGHKRTFAVQRLMSALPPKADMCSATRDVRYGPIADIMPITQSPLSAVVKSDGGIVRPQCLCRL